MTASAQEIADYLHKVPNQYRGPGGAVAVVQNGKVLGQQVWGYADMDRRIPMTARTQLPICSISKQMVCLALMDLARNPNAAIKNRGGDIWTQLQEELRVILPQYVDHPDGELTIANLANMQSGIRDYWAMTTVWGAKPDGPFSILHDAPSALARTKSFHFAPGTEYSYSNVNFHILGKLLEKVSGESLGQLLAQRVFVPAGMKTAALCPNTAGLPLPCVGYEFKEENGYLPAINRIEWEGDAGIAASLEDMIAYESWLHRSWKEPESSYRDIAKPQTYKNGDAAVYNFGLGRAEIDGNLVLGHGGALRGFRLTRLSMPDKGLSVVVMFNHEADAAAAADSILKQVIQWKEPTQAVITATSDWKGNYLDEETQLYVKVEDGVPGELKVSYARAQEKIKFVEANRAASKIMSVSLEGDILTVDRLKEHRTLKARRIPNTPNREDYAGKYRCEESDSTFSCSGVGGIMYGAFDGFLGKGPMHMMRFVAGDVWLLADPRGMDAQPPGDWTVVFRRGGDGKISGVTIGCWLARKLDFVKSE